MKDTYSPPLEPDCAGRRVVIGIPTAARPEIVAETVRRIAEQDRLPDAVYLSVSDLCFTGGVEAEPLPFPVKVLTGSKGLSRQRNRILNELGADDLLLFLDDDFLMAPDYLAEVERIFDSHPEIVLLTGTLVADGILGPGLNHVQGQALLDAALETPVRRELAPEHTGYGCNTAIRMAPVLKERLHFDEHLPLYSWLEDVDFSARLQPFGRFVRPTSLRGVHLGTKTGRTPGKNLGYSQIANPIYMLRKGTMSWRRARNLMVRHIGSNLLGTVRPRPWADYRGRLIGNLTALLDLCLGRCDPQRILAFSRTADYQDGRWRKRAS